MTTCSPDAPLAIALSFSTMSPTRKTASANPSIVRGGPARWPAAHRPVNRRKTRNPYWSRFLDQPHPAGCDQVAGGRRTRSEALRTGSDARSKRALFVALQRRYEEDRKISSRSPARASWPCGSRSVKEKEVKPSPWAEFSRSVRRRFGVAEPFQRLDGVVPRQQVFSKPANSSRSTSTEPSKNAPRDTRLFSVK